MADRVSLPFIEAFLLGVALQASVLYDEPHPLVEGGRDGWRLFPEENVNGSRDSVAELGVFTDWALTAQSDQQYQHHQQAQTMCPHSGII